MRKPITVMINCPWLHKLGKETDVAQRLVSRTNLYVHHPYCVCSFVFIIHIHVVVVEAKTCPTKVAAWYSDSPPLPLQAQQ